MRNHILLTLSVLALTAIPALAQDRAVPRSREQITMSFAPLVKQVAPAVVNIYTKRTITRAMGNPFMNDPFFRQFFGNNFSFGAPGGLRREQVEGALGSGVIVDEKGLVVTNAHVIEGADEIRVVLPDGREFDARVSLSDKPSDLALLRLENVTTNLPKASLKESEMLEVGDLVVAIGNPFGVGQTVTSGIVSALARSSLNINDYNFFIQTDAAVNPGNSGGPLVAMDGSVVGINTAIYSQSGGNLGISFAIPSEMVMSVIAAESGEPVKGGKGITRPWLGVTAQAVTGEIADSLGLEKVSGCLISALHPESPLKKGGARVGDVIMTMNGKPMHDPAEMKFRMATLKLGESADVGIFRAGKTINVKVKAIAPPDSPPRDETLLRSGPFSGATISNINPAVMHQLGDAITQRETGVIVMQIEPRSVASRFIAPGDIIENVNGVPVGKVSDLKRILARPAAGWNIILDRNGQKQQLMLR